MQKWVLNPWSDGTSGVKPFVFYCRVSNPTAQLFLNTFSDARPRFCARGFLSPENLAIWFCVINGLLWLIWIDWLLRVCWRGCLYIRSFVRSFVCCRLCVVRCCAHKISRDVSKMVADGWHSSAFHHMCGGGWSLIIAENGSLKILMCLYRQKMNHDKCTFSTLGDTDFQQKLNKGKMQ